LKKTIYLQTGLKAAIQPQRLAPGDIQCVSAYFHPGS